MRHWIAFVCAAARSLLSTVLKPALHGSAN